MIECGNCGHLDTDHKEHGHCMARGTPLGLGFCICWQFVRPEEATAEMRARRVFGRNNWHSVYSIKDAFQPGGKCHHRDCDQPAARRIMCNIWGSVAEYDCCEQHAEQYHGKLLDDFPGRAA